MKKVIKSYPFFYQLDPSDCGPTCLRMIAKFYGKSFSTQKLKELSFNNKSGSSLTSISEAAEKLGFKTLMAKISFEKLKNEITLPIIVLWRQSHFIVVYEVNRKNILVGDPVLGLVKYTHEEFKDGWINSEVNDKNVGISLLLEPLENGLHLEESTEKKWNLSFIIGYIKPHYKLLIQLLMGMIAGSFLQMLFPLLTQSIVDKGIGSNDFGFVNLILIAQLVLLFSRLIIDFIQSRIFLFVGTRISFTILSDFLIKLMKLPISFFENKSHGDILQRIGDSGKIQNFLTGTILNLIISFFSLLIFSVILFLYNYKLFVVFFIGSAFNLIWAFAFLNYQRKMNIKFFENSSNNQNILIQLISGIKEIKLYNSERKNRIRWESLQAKSYNLTAKNLNVGQIQQTGSFFINETKNILITYFTVTSVMNGEITLGMMLSVQYIIGQLNGPVSAFIGLTSTLQQVKISIERLREIFDETNEENENVKHTHVLFDNQSIIMKNIYFQYGSLNSPRVLKDINLTVPGCKVTAIVGASGSGKSSLMKILLRLYEPTTGELFVGDIRLSNVSQSHWREKCGAVLQDGYIFADTIAQNITMADETINYDRLKNACNIANISNFIENLPLGYNTKIGPEGMGISEGQKQRLFIARAVYKNPQYLFLDEATNSLDTGNERVIVNNLNDFFKARTVIIIAHRLSTIVNADKIVVMQEGEIVEEGVHSQLINAKGVYYELIKNQLELGQY